MTFPKNVMKEYSDKKAIIQLVCLFIILGYCYGSREDEKKQDDTNHITDEAKRLIRSADGYQRDCDPAKTWDGVSAGLCTRTVYGSRRVATGGSWWRSTKYYYVKTSEVISYCCDGYGYTSTRQIWSFSRRCMPKCHGVVSLKSCNRYEGRVKYKDGQTITCSGGKCIAPNKCVNCNTGYYSNSDGTCRACTSIDHCNIPICASSTSSTCGWCDGEIKPDKGWYAYKNSRVKCERACSWRNGARCYPGTCSGDMLYPRDCNCADGFSGPNCATFSSVDDKIKPQITNYEMTLHGKHPPFHLPNPEFQDRKEWTNIIDWSSVDIVAKSTFQMSSTTIPSYIDGSSTKIGIDSLSVTAVLKRGQVSSNWKLGSKCNFTPSGCNIIINNTVLTGTAWNDILKGGYPTPFAHLDSITLTVSTTNGGKVYYYDREANGRRKSYDIHGITVSKTFQLAFDLYPPGHCLELQEKCKEQPLKTPDFVKQSTFEISWNGWWDNDAGLLEYSINIVSLKVKDSSVKEPILESTNNITFNKIVQVTEKSTAVNITVPGPYFIEMAATDRAGNYKLTRRILLFDDQSVVDLQGKAPFAATADNKTGFTWINRNASSIQMVWFNRFINIRHSANFWLNAVAAHDQVSRDLDDIGNISARGTSKIHNNLGIVRYTIGYNISYGFNTTIVTKDFVTVPPEHFDVQSMVIHEELVDGKQLTFMIRGYDVMDEFAEDNTTVKIDLSPPVIRNLWLTKGDIQNISVHNVAELNQLTFEWEVHDIHSGLSSISWKLFDNYTKAVVVHGNGHETPQGEAKTLHDCILKYGAYPRGANCYCTPFDGCFHQHYQVKPQITITGDDGLLVGKDTGVHESDYLIEITAVNRAYLKTVHTLKITIDTSPPHQGVVHDGFDSQPEVDFQQSFSLVSHWSGFFDKESGVRSYMYGYGTSCLKSSDFDIESEGINNLTKTYLTNGQFTATSPGKYYITVAAYNHALDHSIPVCSDGVTVDASVAEITEIIVKGAVTRKGLIRDNSSRVWAIYTDRVIEEIKSPTQICINKATLISVATISSLPVKRYINGSISHSLTSAECNSLNGVHPNMVSFVFADTHLDLSWNVTHGLSSVHDFEVGLSSQSIGTPDKMDFVSAKQHQHFRIIYPDIWDGEEFYIVLKAITKAAVESKKVIGPFAVDTTKPVVNGDVNVSLEEDHGSKYLVARWSSSMFEDHGDPSPLFIEVALGTKTNERNILPFEHLSPGGSCSVPITCTAININELPWSLHGHQSYYVTLKATNTIGLHVLAYSGPYIHDIDLASKGVVFDAGCLLSKCDIEDIDFQTRSDELTVRWAGFRHPHLDIVFYACFSVANATAELTCEAYYQYVIAQTDVGNVTVASDVITIVAEDDELAGIVVYDGLKCEMKLDNSFVNATGHHSEDKRLVCQDELEYQSSTNQLHAYWTVPEDIKRFTPDVYWAIEERAPVAEHWERYSDYNHIKTSYQVKANNLFLVDGRRYRISIKFCATVYCFRPIKSNGVTIVPNPPVGGSMNVSHSNTTNTLHVELLGFHDPDIEDLDESRQAMDHYEWALTDNSLHGRLLSPWQRVNVTVEPHGQIAFAIPLNNDIAFTKCWKVSVRGYTKAGLSSVVSAEIRNCSDIQKIRPSVIIDVVGQALKSVGSIGIVHEGQPISLEENNIWTETDMDYTPYQNILSAVWPTLRYKVYTWAVLDVHEEDPSVFYASNNTNIHDPCSHPDAVKCGQTEYEYMNALFEKDELLHGRRYTVCIHANETENVYEKWSETLDAISVCSDGITVDLTPPVPETVWIGRNIGDKYQTSSSDMSVNWKSFIDVEEEGNSVHSSGIANYQVALGSSHRGVDIVDFTEVGLTNHHIFHGLQLQSGHSYFATVRARDFTNQVAESVSPAAKVDTTPPDVTTSPITIDKRHITDIASVSACWEGVFVDKESGISRYMWSVGTQPGYEDAMNYTQTTMECAETDSNCPLAMIEGHGYFVSVKAYNNAGLFSTAVSWAFIVDASPPMEGHVYDGPRDKDGNYKDVDYLESNSVIEAHWSDFHEQHGAIKEYFINAGSCKGCDDILVRQPIGITYDIVLNMLHLAEGMIYYVTVTACNTVDMCTSSTSDGVIVDSSPPTPGRVLDGTEGDDVQYQASKIYIGAQWYGFSDPQSDISHYVWRVGTSVGRDDILAATDVHTSAEAFILDLSLSGTTLPVGVRIFTTVRVYNKAGMYSEATSNGFVVDDTPPIFTTSLSHIRIGSILPNTSILKSVLRIEWIVEDNQSFIDNQFLSISSHMGGDFNISSIKVAGIVRDYTFTRLVLHDGSRYCINLVSCNGAKLCTASILQNILIDSSHPTPGMFAIDTDHAANLKREPDSWMTWTILGIRLAWLGFEDEYSDITKYMINIGSTYMGNDLNKVLDKPIVVFHNESGDLNDEGVVQVKEIETKSLAKYQNVFISIWAENGVGLSSPIIHSEFNLVYGGMMELVRRCSAQTCYGHCVCAPHGELCHTNTDCNNGSKANPIDIVNVEDYIDLTFPEDNPLVTCKHSPLNSMMAAKWTSLTTTGMKPIWFETSVGLNIHDSPKGVFDEANSRVWHDAGHKTSWVISLPSSHLLQEKHNYSFFVRAWYDRNTYAVFKSPGVLIYSTPPKSIVIQGRRIKETKAGDDKDKDFFDKNMLVEINWKGKFENTESSLLKYHLYISTTPGGHDTHVLDQDIPPTVTHFNITGLDFAENTWYYGVVQAYNHAGLHTTECSDGFMIDNKPPSKGTVHDGEGFHDVHALNSSSEIPSFWHGFTDAASGIKGYEVCITSNEGNKQCDIHTWVPVGIVTRTRIRPNTSVVDGTVVYTEVRANDAVGHTSDIVKSNGVVIDSSPPSPGSEFFYGNNVLNNPSFETSAKTHSIDTLINVTECYVGTLSGWLASTETCIVTVKAKHGEVLPDGSNFLVIKGKISQQVNNIEGSRKFRLTFFTSHVPTDTSMFSSNEGCVKLNNEMHMFLLYSKPSNSEASSNKLGWHKHTFFFETHTDNITITLATFGRTSHFALDNVKLEQISETNKGIEAERQGHVQAHTVFIYDWSSVHSNWNFVDEESTIIEYLWAIGTVEGGTQLQDFVSVGRRTFAYTYSLHLVHNTAIYITVVAVNAAGLRTVSYSDPIIIDLTPPDINWIYDGPFLAEDIDFQQNMEVSANWNIKDKESGIAACEWAIGVQQGDTSLQDYTSIPTHVETVSASLHDADLPDKMIYVSLKCTNNAGLMSYGTTNGVMVIKSSPSGENVLLEILTNSNTQYPAHGNYHGDSTRIKFRWTGFKNDEGIDSYLVALDGDTTHMTELVEGTTDGFSYVSFSDLHLPDGNYTVSVTAINHLQMYSQRRSEQFYILTRPPKLTGNPITTHWERTNKQFDASWTDVFFSNHPMYFEVTVDQVEGGDGDILQWQETKDTTLSIQLDTEKMAGKDVNIRVSIRAISHCGLFETARVERLIDIDT